MTAVAMEREACQLIPGDAIRRAGRAFRCIRVAVTVDQVTIEAEPLETDATVAREVFEFARSELVRTPLPAALERRS